MESFDGHYILFPFLLRRLDEFDRQLASLDLCCRGTLAEILETRTMWQDLSSRLSNGNPSQLSPTAFARLREQLRFDVDRILVELKGRLWQPEEGGGVGVVERNLTQVEVQADAEQTVSESSTMATLATTSTTASTTSWPESPRSCEDLLKAIYYYQF